MAYISNSASSEPGRCRTCGGRIVRLAHGGNHDSAWYGCERCVARASLPAPKPTEPLNARQTACVSALSQFWKGSLTANELETMLLPEDVERAKFWRYLGCDSSCTITQAEEFVRGMRSSRSPRFWRRLTSVFSRRKQPGADFFDRIPRDIIQARVDQHVRELMPRWGHNIWKRRDVFWILYNLREYAGKVPCREMEHAIKMEFRKHVTGSMDS